MSKRNTKPKAVGISTHLVKKLQRLNALERSALRSVAFANHKLTALDADLKAANEKKICSKADEKVALSLLTTYTAAYNAHVHALNYLNTVRHEIRDITKKNYATMAGLVSVSDSTILGLSAEPTTDYFP